MGAGVWFNEERLMRRKGAGCPRQLPAPAPSCPWLRAQHPNGKVYLKPDFPVLPQDRAGSGGWSQGWVGCWVLGPSTLGSSRDLQQRSGASAPGCPSHERELPLASDRTPMCGGCIVSLIPEGPQQRGAAGINPSMCVVALWEAVVMLPCFHGLCLFNSGLHW